MNNKIQQRDDILQTLITQFNFEPTGVADQLYVSQETGAVLSWNGSQMELSFGFNKSQDAEFSEPKKPKQPIYHWMLGGNEQPEAASFLHQIIGYISSMVRAWRIA